MPTAIINITITGWKPLLTPPQTVGGSATGHGNSTFSDAKYDLVPGAARVTVSSDGNIVANGAVTLKFRFCQFCPTDVNLRAYYPVGIGVYSLGDGDRGVVNSASFPRDQVSFGFDVDAPRAPIPWVQMTDVCLDTVPKNYEYYIIFQDNSGSFGAIDPDIDNEAQN